MSWSTILVGTDGSERANRAVAHAGALAAALGSELIVVTAYGQGPVKDPSELIPAEIEWAATASGAAQETAQKAAEVAKAAGATRVRARSMGGDPLEALSAVAQDTGAGLVVVGSRGMKSATRFLTGSVPNEITHHADRDVLVVHTD